ncbi:Halomucin [Zootermopsis nevadensis]|uniref:Halomucin n=1 Tax=Zootermopsis nevadensis TaxID=136037 RepID=A0A067QEV7_ZOONE|nr:Halomucin [Zootermopsis nevadensis]
MESFKRLIGDLIGAGKKEKCREQILVKTKPLFIILTHFARVEIELEVPRDRNKDVEDMRRKIKDLQKQHVIDMRNTHETINGLIHVVSSIMAENVNLKQQIQSFHACHYQELAPACSENWDEDRSEKRDKDYSENWDEGFSEDWYKDCSENWDEDCSENWDKDCSEIWDENCSENWDKDYSENWDEGFSEDCENWDEDCSEKRDKDCSENWDEDCSEKRDKDCSENWDEDRSEKRDKDCSENWDED